ncbi:hypothetical protein L2D01_06555 [Hyphomonadaceae bacterium ML37]|nr:hypothetical protein L2D01_06555 [Hyphomonadaceae bacterium ML37]
MAALDARFRRVTGRANRLEIFEVEGAFGVRPHRLDVINLEPGPGAALDTSPAIAAQRLQADGLPAARFQDRARVAGKAV